MSTTAFDSLATARALEQAGMDSAHAEAVTEAIGGAVSSANVVTREYLDARLAELETRMTWRMFAIVGGLLALVTALDRLLGA